MNKMNDDEKTTITGVRALWAFINLAAILYVVYLIISISQEAATALSSGLVVSAVQATQIYTMALVDLAVIGCLLLAGIALMVAVNFGAERG